MLGLVGDALRSQGNSEKKANQGVDKLVKAYKTHAAGALEEYESPMSLAEFACKEHGVQARTLEAFVNEYKCRGEKLVAAGMHSMSNDRYYGQWLVLNVPFRLLEDFLSTETDIVEKVPVHYRHFAIALRRAPSFWGDDRAIEEQMALEAHSKARINTILSKVRAQRFLVEKYLSGDLDDWRLNTKRGAGRTRPEATRPRSVAGLRRRRRSSWRRSRSESRTRWLRPARRPMKSSRTLCWRRKASACDVDVRVLGAHGRGQLTGGQHE